MSRLSITKEPEVVVQNTEPFILTSESFEDYSNSFKYIEALYEEVNNQHELNRYMSECLILAENSTPYVKMQKLKALNEEDTLAIGDKSSSNTGWFDKIINFIKKIWGKFVEKITRWITTNNYYLEKYKDIILKKEPKIGNIQFDGASLDFATAENNIMRITLMPSQTISDQTFHNLPAVGDNDQAKNAAIAQYASLYNKAFDAYKANAGEEFKAWCVEFFEGKKVQNAKSEINPADLNWTNMYNFCHDANNVINAIKKDQETLQKQCDSVIAAIKKWYEDYKNSDDTRRGTMNSNAAIRKMETDKLNANSINIDTTKNLSDDEKKKIQPYDDKVKAAETAFNNARNGKSDDGKTDIPENQRESNLKAKEATLTAAKEALKQAYGQIERDRAKQNITNANKNDVDNQNDQSHNRQQSPQTAQHASGEISAVYKTYLTEENLANTYNANAARNVSTDITHKTTATTDEDINKEVSEIESKGKVYIDTGKDILSAKLTATEFIYSQYMKIIRAHVESYVGKPVDASTNKSATAQQGTNYNNAAPQQQTVNDVTPQQQAPAQQATNPT